MASIEEKDKKTLNQSNTVPAASSSSQIPAAGSEEAGTSSSGSKLTNEGKKKITKEKPSSVSDSTAPSGAIGGVSMETADPVINEEQEVERRKLQ